jgi:hypothetical protein
MSGYSLRAVATRGGRGQAEPQAAFAMEQGQDARTRELDNLRLALATFALQLDTFELRANGALRAADKNAAKSNSGKNDWASIKSAGNKSDT